MIDKCTIPIDFSINFRIWLEKNIFMEDSQHLFDF